MARSLDKNSLMMCLGMYNKWVKIFNVSPDFFYQF